MSWFLHLGLPYVSAFLEALLAGKLIYTGLAKRFRWFTLYLLVIAPRDIVMAQLPRNTRLYEQIWAWSGILLLILQAAVVFEAYSRVRAQISDLGKWGWRFLLLIGGFAAAVAVSTTWIDLRKPLTKSLTQAAYTLAQRNFSVALAIIAVLAVAVFFPFRIRLSRNSLVHSYIWAAYFSSNAIIFGLMNLELVRRQTAGFAIMFTAIACYGAWSLLLTREGEATPPQKAPLSKVEMDELEHKERSLFDAERITRQLKPAREAHPSREERP